MIQKEVIEIKNFIKGTKSINFFGVDHSDFSSFPIGYLIMDASGAPIKIVDNKFDAQFKRLPDNTFQYIGNITGGTISDITGNGNVITGRTSTQTFNYEISLEQQGIARQKFIEINKQNYGKDNVYWAEFSSVSVNDLYANVSLVKTYNMLNTLSVINSVQGESPFKESSIGIVFGKIEALQKISDENGNKIRIPLANIPVAIFNTTDEFPDVSSVDLNSNRIVLNLKENSSKSQYFSDETYTFAQDFLTSSTTKSIPDKYRYSALTNDKGEFIIYNVPTGTQTFMVEVDLLKQGMTKDEVSLNFFPYPTTSNPNVDNVPHLYFRQFAINVVPSWSDFQSGYTQLNVTIPLDLRKWATYIFPPVAFVENEKLEVTVAKNAARKLKIQIRDMTGKDSATGKLYPLKSLTLSKIQVDTDRDEGSQYIWFNEFAENRRQVEYNEFSCYVVKLPANLYDPDGYKTDSNGVPTQSKGVWLASYQLKEFIEESSSSRATGGYSYWINGKYYLISHFDLNNVFGNDIEQSYPVGEENVTSSKNAKFGQFPYEKPWSINYPIKYSIPSKPVIERFKTADDGVKRQLYDSTNKIYFLEEPAYEDGDLVGLDTVENLPAAGFGLQYIPDSAGNSAGVFFPNRISEVATKSFTYKYERDISWNETYANGYEPFWDIPTTKNPFAGISKVKNGEKYQRLECGYGYFMKPQAWPRYVRSSFGADIPSKDIQTGSNAVVSPRNTPLGVQGEMYSPKEWNVDIYNIDGQNLALALGNKNLIKRGNIDIYRIVESGVQNIIVPVNFVIPTYARLHCRLAQAMFSFSLRNDGEIMVKIKNGFRRGVYYGDVNGNVKFANVGEIIEFYPGQSMFLSSEGSYVGDVTNALYFSMNLPGNQSYDTDLNQYTVANYTFIVTYSKINANTPAGPCSYNLNVGASTSISDYWVRTRIQQHGKGKVDVVSEGLGRFYVFGNETHNGKYNHISYMFIEGGSELSPHYENGTYVEWGYNT